MNPFLSFTQVIPAHLHYRDGGSNTPLHYVWNITAMTMCEQVTTRCESQPH